ncbi:MAG: ABC transporter permease [Bacillota bacterium]
MRLDSIAVNNLARRKMKTLFACLGLILAVGTVVTLHTVTSAIRVGLADAFDEIGANIIVVPADEQSIAYGGVVIPSPRGFTALTNDDVISINTIKDRDSIATVAPKVLAEVEVRGEPVMAVGVDFPYELRLKKWWKWQGERPVGVDHLLVGSRVAEKFGLKPGDPLFIEGYPFQVTAVLEPQGTEEDGLIFMQLLKAQEIAGQDGRLNLIEVAAYCTTCPIEEIVEQISHSLPHARVTALAEAVEARRQVVDRFTLFAYTVSGVVVVIGSLMVLLTMLASVKERTKEIGVFRAIGYRKSHIFEIILTEAILLGLAGGILGYLLGMAAAQVLGPVLAQGPVTIPWQPLAGGITVIGATGLAVAASLYPAAQAANLDPAEALRFI